MHANGERFYFDDAARVRPLSALPVLIEHLRALDRDGVEPLPTIAFPDDGAAKRFADCFGPEFRIIVCSKVREGDRRIVRIVDRRNWPAAIRPSALHPREEWWASAAECTVEARRSKIYASEDPMAHVLIVDDLVQSGGTLHECRVALQGEGAKSVSAYVTHAVFPNDSHLRFTTVGGDRSGFRHIYVTDTNPVVATKLRALEPFCVLSIVPALGTDILQMLGRSSDPFPTSDVDVYVASTADTKIEAAKLASAEFFGLSRVRVHGCAVPSGVAAQPEGLEEIRRGCSNRMTALMRSLSSRPAASRITVAVSIESGLVYIRERDAVNRPKIHGSQLELLLPPPSTGPAVRMAAYDVAVVHLSVVGGGEPWEQQVMSPGVRVPSEAVRRARSAGFATRTVGEELAVEFGCASDNWHAAVHATSRASLLQEAIAQALQLGNR